MTQLYSTLAGIYHEMYQHIFDYDKEFGFYDSLLQRNHCRKILEIGCGSGMLARRFIQNGYDYLGLDLYSEMLDIARSEVKADCFVQCDMRNLSFVSQFDAVLITGRSLAYITENKGILDTFTGIHKSMKENGLLIFGVFNAHELITHLNDFEQTIEHDQKKITRINRLEKNLETGWTYNWYATYVVEQNGQRTETEDITTLRTFTRDEIQLFLKLTGFRVIETIDEGKAFTFIAEKTI
jgi:SAM-dependent methyltransferase